MIQQIQDGDQILAIVIRAGFAEEGVHFLTPNQFSQQLAYMKHPAGKKIDAHWHSPQPRSVEVTQEVLCIRKGALRVDFYRNDQTYLESHILRQGDVILLAHGAHGFEVLEPLEMIEVKQGPYAGDGEKTRFPSVAAEQIRIVS
jgi:mannose-6-phosphate isomerase-like protein (cupin superfamily)